MSPKELRAKQLQEAQAKFVLAIKVAKAQGVDVAAIFLEVTEQVMLAWVRCFGLCLGIVFIACAPFIPPTFRVLCFVLKMPYELNEIYYYWPFLVGIVAIISFGYNLVDPRTLKRITGKSKLAEDEHRLSTSGHYIIEKPNDELNGDV